MQVGVYLIKFSAQHLDPDFSKKKQVRTGWLWVGLARMPDRARPLTELSGQGHMAPRVARVPGSATLPPSSIGLWVQAGQYTSALSRNLGQTIPQLDVYEAVSAGAHEGLSAACLDCAAACAGVTYLTLPVCTMPLAPATALGLQCDLPPG